MTRRLSNRCDQKNQSTIYEEDDDDDDTDCDCFACTEVADEVRSAKSAKAASEYQRHLGRKGHR